MHELRDWIEPLKAMHARMRDTLVAACEATAMEQLANADTDQEGDIIYAIDRVSEEHLMELSGNSPYKAAAVDTVPEPDSLP